MAYKDLRASLTNPAGLRASTDSERIAEIERMFLEVAVEIGMADTEMFATTSRPEDAHVVVYDKFKPRYT